MKGSSYYGSDLNRLIDERCSRRMTCINIDCFLVKVAQKRIRFIESKHSGEGMKKGQKTSLGLLSGFIHPSYTIDSFIVRGEYPYHTAIVENIATAEVIQLDQRDLISWLNFEPEKIPESMKESTPLSEIF